jgi:hypothetical protein
LKIANLLAQYLYTNKRLDLPGIGTFLLDQSIIIDEKSKNNPVTEAIRFQSNPSIRDVADLVNYISTKSGKMKVLAESDLESHIQIVQQFLNINKPFSFDGIGTLVKIKQGEFEFTPGNVVSTKLKTDVAEKDKPALSKKENVDAKYQAFLATPVIKSKWKKPVITLLIIAGIGLAVLGGYVISTRQTGGEALVSGNSIDQPALIPDSSQSNAVAADTTKKMPSPESYKYVLEITKGSKAFRRYTQLKDTDLKLKDTNLSDAIQMETTDSVQYKLFVRLPVSDDTTKVMTSLASFLGKKVYIEHQN